MKPSRRVSALIFPTPWDDAPTFTMWRVFSAFIWNGLMESYADMPTMPLIEEATGAHVEFREVPDSAAYEQFNLRIASGDFCDFMAMDYYTGGVEAAYEEDIVLDLTDMVEEHMPNYMAVVDTMDDYTLKSSTPKTAGFSASGPWLPMWSPSRA